MEIKMSEFEPLNIAHYQQPTSPLSDGAAPYLEWIEVKRLVTDKTYQREISRAGSINVSSGQNFLPSLLLRWKAACSQL